ncbi:MAG: glycosyltransferase family A protein [Pyrinomonadaceae bacterium]
MNQQHTSNGSTTHADGNGVSVVVPSYNHARFIQMTLRSIFNQTLTPKELLVIDDGSSDSSSQIIEHTLQDCPFPSEFIARANRGLCATLNEGLAKTSGKYFAYLSSDDVWLPDFLKARVSLLEASPRAVLGYGHCYFIDAENLIIDCTFDWADYTNGDAREMLLQQTYAPMSPTVLYRRSNLEQNGWDEQAKLEDYDLYLRLSTEGDFAFDSRILSAWRQHHWNTSRDFSWMIEARLAAQQRVADRLGLNARELEHFQRVLKFAGMEDLLRLGEKAKAIKLLRQSFGGAPSPASYLRLLARIGAPGFLMSWRRRRRQTRAAERYGPLII